jgi:hypothetical protein
MAEGRPMIFADGMTEATVTHGVARITLAQTGTDGKPMAVGQLCVPLLQLPAFANGLVNLLKQVEQRAKQAQAGQAQKPAGSDSIDSGNGAGDISPIPGAFRFSG